MVILIPLVFFFSPISVSPTNFVETTKRAIARSAPRHTSIIKLVFFKNMLNRFKYRLILLSQRVPCHHSRTLGMTSLSCGFVGLEDTSTSFLQSTGSSNWVIMYRSCGSIVFCCLGNTELCFLPSFEPALSIGCVDWSKPLG